MKMKNGDAVELSRYARRLKLYEGRPIHRWVGTAVQVHFDAVRVAWSRPGREPRYLWHSRRDIRLWRSP